MTSPANLPSHFDAGTFARGAAYFEEGRVLESRRQVMRGSDVVTGRVQGAGGRVYEVFVAVDRAGNGIVIEGDCSCPVGYNCKHVVSVLLAGMTGRDPGEETFPAAHGVTPAAVSATVAGWVQQLMNAKLPDSKPRGSPGTFQSLLFLLLPSDPRDGYPVPRVRPVLCRRLKKGGYGKVTPFSVRRAWEPYPPNHLLPEDVAILRGLTPEPLAMIPDEPLLRGPRAGEYLSRMLNTGRCHWLDKDHPVLGLGDERLATPAWEVDELDRQRLVFQIQPPAGVTLGLSPPWYLDESAACCGPIRSGLNPELARLVALAPPVEPGEVEALQGLLRERLPDAGLPEPHVLPVEEVTVTPRPRLELGLLTLPVEYDYPGGAPSMAVARLTFDYGGRYVDRGDPQHPFKVREADRLLRFKRDRSVEEQALQVLLAAGLEPVTTLYYDLPSPDKWALMPDIDEDEFEVWLELQSEVLPGLAREGWEVQVAPEFPFIIRQPEAWYGDLAEGGGGNWFDLDLGVEIEGERLSLLPVLLNFLRGADPRRMQAGLDASPADETLPLPLPEGGMLALPVGRVRDILAILIELYDPRLRLLDGRLLRLNAPRAGQLLDLGEGRGNRAPWHWQGGERQRELGRRLENFKGLDTGEAPPGFQAKLRDYQREGLGWLQFLREYGLGGVLADDMGLGKTVQTLAHVLLEKHSGRMDHPSLVVAPTSLMVNWRVEAERFAPGLRVLVLHGPDRARHFERLADYDLVLTTYPLLPRDREVLLEQPFHLLILDEAQNIKNPRAQAGQVARGIEARHRLCLTGTPLENHLGELWSLFDFLQPGLLGDERQFQRLFRTPVEKHQDTNRQAALARRVAPFLLRRTKDQVARELPPKTEITREVELAGTQRDLYESIRIAMHEKVREAISRHGVQRSHIIILDALLKLRQVCCDPRLVNLESARKVRESAKLNLLMDLLPEMLEEGRRVLLFSQFTSMLALIQERLDERGIRYEKLTGSTRDRETPVRRFQAGEVPVFLISLKAGGTGLNLTAADTVIHYDPWWNPAVENQATDRAHRIGQDKPVFVYRLITAGTVEDRIVVMQAKKRQLADALFQEGGTSAARLSAADLDLLFQPLEGA